MTVCIIIITLGNSSVFVRNEPAELRNFEKDLVKEPKNNTSREYLLSEFAPYTLYSHHEIQEKLGKGE